MTGLTLEINTEEYDYTSELSQESGVRVFIGNQLEMPFPYEEGMSVSPGHSTAIQLRKVCIQCNYFGVISLECLIVLSEFKLVFDSSV